MKLVLLGSALAITLGALAAYALLARVDPGPSFHDEAGRLRSCGIRSRPDGSQYCAAELAEKNPQSMSRCRRADHTGVLVEYLGDQQPGVELDICCECGLVQPRDTTHANMTLDDINRAYATDPVCWRPGLPCPANGRPPCGH